jgi:hypothetical protein
MKRPIRKVTKAPDILGLDRLIDAAIRYANAGRSVNEACRGRRCVRTSEANMKRPMRKVTKASLMPNGHRVPNNVDTPCDHVDLKSNGRGGFRCYTRAVWCVYRRGGGTIAFDYFCDVHWTTKEHGGKTPKQRAETRS